MFEAFQSYTVVVPQRCSVQDGSDWSF